MIKETTKESKGEKMKSKDKNKGKTKEQLKGKEKQGKTIKKTGTARNE